MQTGDPVFSTKMVRAITDAATSGLGEGAYVKRFMGVVSAVDEATNTVSVKIQGNTTASTGFSVRGQTFPIVNDLVHVCIMGQQRWVESLATSASQKKHIVRSDGTLLWGPGGSNYDTSLYRSAADTLATDDKFNASAAFPSTPLTGLRWFRTDLGMEFYYDGTRWLSTQLLSIALASSEDGTDTSGVTNVDWMSQGLHGGSDLWIEEVEYLHRVESGSTLGASHNWVINVYKAISSSTSFTSLSSKTVNSGSVSTQYLSTDTIDALFNGGTTHIGYRITLTKTGTPGGLYWGVRVNYRVVAT